jgi:tRNA modification GTPase
MLTDVITALATPPGRSALAVIRVSGSGAIQTVQRLTRHELASVPDRSATLCTLRAADGTTLDQAILTLYRAPHSYTGQDLVELSCHGGLLVPAQILAALHCAGARQADPGEFTRRALLGGKLDLLQAEAVADLIDATAPAQGRAALHQLEGELSRRIHGMRETLLELLSLLAYDIDFPEEDDGPVPPERILAQLVGAQQSIARLLATAPSGERLREGALVVLAGRPNSGKSSLFNALLGIDRALVTEIPGTTRDTIEASSQVQGWPVRLADTAGLRDADERLERMGIEVSRRYVAAADLLLLCVEAGRRLTVQEQQLLDERPALLVRSKVDLVPVAQRESESGYPVSAVTGEGLDGLCHAIADRLFSSERRFASLEPMLTRERHREALARAGRALEEAKLELGDAVLAAHQVREAIAALEELIGVVHPDEVLGRVFERFCVGK